MASVSGASWSAVFRKGWQLTGQNLVPYLAFLAVQLGAWFVISPSITSWKFGFNGSAPMGDVSTSSVDALYMLLALFLSLAGYAFALSVVRGRGALDEALQWSGARLWNMVWLCAMVCGSIFLSLFALAALFGSATLGAVFSVTLGDGFLNDPLNSLPSLLSAAVWPVLGALVLLVGAVTVALGWSFAPFAIIDGAGPLAALQKSWHGTYGHRWQILFLHLVPMVCASLAIVVAILLTMLVGLLKVSLLTGIFGFLTGVVGLGALVLASGVSFFGLAALYTAVVKK